MRCLPIVALLLVITNPVSGQGAASRPLVPDAFELAAPARESIRAAWLTDDERKDARVQHGVWTESDLDDPQRRARAALIEWRIADPIFDDARVPIEWRAEVRSRRGEYAEAIELLEGVESIDARRLRGSAYASLGQFEAAAEVLGDVPTLGEISAMDEVDDIVAAVRGRLTLARVEGQPVRDWSALLNELTRTHQEIDRLAWSGRLAEARLLVEKHTRIEAARVLHETLELNPRSAEAWYELGRLAVRSFDFDGVQRAVDALNAIVDNHPLGVLLRAESRMFQDDPYFAAELLDALLLTYPEFREARMLRAAAAGLMYDETALAAELAAYDELSPGSPDAYFVAGRFLSTARQYGWSAELLEEAVRRQPAWSAPRIELGLLEMQSGRDDRALRALQDAVAMDPYDKRAANSLVLLEALTQFDEIETDHFIIRYRPGIDEVLVRMMPPYLEEIHEVVSGRFGLEPMRKTVVEVMPDHKHFAVRITGLPSVHTIAACTGPVLAMEVPREGRPSMHQGVFDWERVLRHEYTHTVTLEQTRNRVPLWLTEAAAVAMELSPRDYADCVMLAQSWRDGTLFDLDEINWGFIRPKRPGDRGKAYTQSHWMLEFMTERWGSSAVIDLLAQYFNGEREADAITLALNVSRDDFYDEFVRWAGEQVKQWGLAAEPSFELLLDELRWADAELAVAMAASQQARLDAIARAMTSEIGEPREPGWLPLRGRDWPELVRPPVEVSDQQLSAWRALYPDHPDILELSIRRRLDEPDMVMADVIPLMERYIAARPVDPYPHRKLAQHFLASDDPAVQARAIPHLEELDIREDYTPVYAWQLANLYRAAGERGTALEKATRAVIINPYDAGYRELAATIAIEARELESARMHIRALTILEPDRPVHQKRLERIEAMLEG